MNLKTTIILLILFALGVAALMLTRGGQDDVTPPPPKDSTDTTTQAILDADELGTGLQRIRFSPGQQGELVLERQAGRWRITSPNAFPANPRALDEVLTVLAGLRGSATTDKQDPASDRPRLSLVYADREMTVALGDRIGGGRGFITVTRGGERRDYVVQDSLHTLFEYFDARLFYASTIDAPLMPDIRRVVITAGNDHSTLTQRDGGWWIERGDRRERALARGLPRHPGVSDYFKLFEAIEIGEHVDPKGALNLAAYGLESPLITARFEPIDAGGVAWVFKVGVPADLSDQTRYASYGPSDDQGTAVFTITTPVALAFAQDATAFRDPRPITTPTRLIESIHTSTPAGVTHTFTFNTDGTAELTRHNDDPVPLPTPGPAVLVTTLYDARAAGYAEAKPADAEPLLSIQIKARLGGATEALTLFTDPEADADKPTVLVRRADEPVLLRVDRAVFEALIDPGRLLPKE